MNQNILVGADPELWAMENGVIVSAHNMIKGDKKNPYKVRNGAVQVDGMALEFNINPASNAEQFIYNIQDVMNQLEEMIPGKQLHVSPVADFDPAYMALQPAEALELGCDPDFNAWLSAINPRPDGNRPMRTASGHVHIGWTENENISSFDHLARCEMLIKQMDFYLGLPSLMYDANTRRREMYGKAGAYRPKSYGVEYRTLSNAWLKSKELMAWVFRATEKGTLDLMNGLSLVDKYGDIQEIINTSDVKAAQAIIKSEKLEVPNA